MEVRTKRWKCFNRCRRCYGLGACTFCGYVEDEEDDCRCSCSSKNGRCSCWCNNGKCYCCCKNGKCCCRCQ